ncbi:hypothetical protein CEUSTIGMA_g6954.t1 [Chlamydomonas eustigma]|uniref:Uncharacterized protein n=1 Tax=Chlamydomonas eustigma TaxID=1157962 RepID=A0A250X8W6_9CHLO|nr:hypothetical protein CEUSTIGMA_g6954.t1 [Chlamydomonas eustigma]|eukprot:GAX79513.1 hypothetical protein CEUSTIGMA_g6954.t1 [Chlamydomonas eustigma]
MRFYAELKSKSTAIHVTHYFCVCTLVVKFGTVAVSNANDPLPPAILPGTPEQDAFPIKSERLIELAKKLFDEQVGVQDYIKAVSGFKLLDAFPDMNPHPYDLRVDPYEPNRVDP